MKAILCLLALVALAYAAAPYTRILSNRQIAKMRCSLDSNDETFFFFNGTVIQYTNTGNTVLFNTIGINVGRCFLVNNTYILSSRELLYYTNPTTNEIINRWVNPEGQEVTVMHVDNDPVIQRFPASMVAPAMVLDGKVVLSLDIPLYYPNPLSNVANNGTFAAYSPQTMYQAGEFFKFISDNADIDDQSKDTVDYSIVSWTRTGPYLPWMKRGNAPGYLIYSSAGNRISSWEEMPAGVKQDLENRIPHYKHAPTCAPAPAVASVSSWSFFKAKFAEFLAGAQFPLSTPAVWACYPGTELPTPAPSTCKAKVDITAGSSWTAGGVTFYTSYLTFKNTGNSAITEIKVNLGGDLKESWNLEGSQSVREVNLWSDLAVGTSTSSSDYGVIARHAPVSVSIVSVQC